MQPSLWEQRENNFEVVPPHAVGHLQISYKRYLLRFCSLNVSRSPTNYGASWFSGIKECKVQWARPLVGLCFITVIVFRWSIVCMCISALKQQQAKNPRRLPKCKQ